MKRNLILNWKKLRVFQFLEKKRVIKKLISSVLIFNSSLMSCDEKKEVDFTVDAIGIYFYSGNRNQVSHSERPRLEFICTIKNLEEDNFHILTSSCDNDYIYSKLDFLFIIEDDSLSFNEINKTICKPILNEIFKRESESLKIKTYNFPYKKVKGHTIRERIDYLNDKLKQPFELYGYGISPCSNDKASFKKSKSFEVFYFFDNQVVDITFDSTRLDINLPHINELFEIEF